MVTDFDIPNRDKNRLLIIKWRKTISENRNNKFPRANREIRSAQVRLVGADGEMVGIVKLSEAMAAASAAGLDLVEISPQAEPPVCKVMDFGKYKYESKKRLQESRKKQKVVSVKEIKFRPNIGEGDLQVKLKNIKKFLQDGDKVRISMWFRGREITHVELGMVIFNRLLVELEDLAKIELEPKIDGKQILMIVVPKA